MTFAEAVRLAAVESDPLAAVIADADPSSATPLPIDSDPEASA
jgi:hypothetical protein